MRTHSLTRTGPLARTPRGVTIGRQGAIGAAVLAVAHVAAGTTPASATTWDIDPAHSSAAFSVRHMMVTNVRGEFSGVQGSIVLDPSNIEASSVKVTIDASTIDTRLPDRDEHLRSADFLDVANHPVMTFSSRRVQRVRDGVLHLTGDLTLRGVTREVTLDVSGPTSPITDPWGNVKRGASATTTIRRSDFGLMWNKVLEAGGLMVSDDVAITIDLELVMKASPPSVGE